MPNVLTSIADLVKSFNDDEPKTPLHVGEVMSCWTHLAVLAEAVVFEQTSANMTTDTELSNFLTKTREINYSQQRRLIDFLQIEGVPLPPSSEPKTASDPYSVPQGARLDDNEIANALSVKLAGSIVACASSAAQSIRNDVGLMFLKLQEEDTTYAMMLKTLMKKRGWLKIPPYYTPSGFPNPAR